MPEVALFLGAGASKAFGYPTTLDFVSNLKEVLQSIEKSIFESILKFPNISDIEDVLRQLDPITNVGSNDYVQTMFRGSTIPQPNQLGVEMKINIFFNFCETLKQSIINELYSQYEFDESKIKKIVEYYDLLRVILANINKNPELHVFTTNYDSVFERYCNNTNILNDFTCGFKTDKRSRREFWHSEWLKNWKFDPNRNKGIRLYKLHGSLDWREMTDGRIERVLTEDRVSSRSRTYKKMHLFIPHKRTTQPKTPLDVCRGILRMSWVSMTYALLSVFLLETF